MVNDTINNHDLVGLEMVKEKFSLTSLQIQQYAALGELYREWNAKINVISRKDIDNLYAHHILHSLAIANVLKFQPGTTLLDVGTGGGFPGIPLAILFPECQFLLIDSIGKKIKVASEIAKALGLANVVCKQERAEEEKQKFTENVLKLLNYGGMVQFDQVSMYGMEIALMKPVEVNQEGKACFHYNYFEEDAWEDAGYNAETGKFYSNKIGGDEFCSV